MRSEINSYENEVKRKIRNDIRKGLGRLKCTWEINGGTGE